jgi:hypothetical protein
LAKICNASLDASIVGNDGRLMLIGALERFLPDALHVFDELLNLRPCIDALPLSRRGAF